MDKKPIKCSLETLIEECRHNGQKVTHQRIEIFREILDSKDHPDAYRVYQGVKQRVPTISLDTVYRNLRSLEEMGLLKVATQTQDRVRFDANLEQHSHFICSKCGAIIDFFEPALDEAETAEQLKEIGCVSSIQIEVKGVCQRCKKQFDKCPIKSDT